MTQLEKILKQAQAERHALTREEIVTLLSLTDPADLQRLHAAAYEVKLRHSGKVVSFRGIIEMGNVCSKDCFYCGIRKGNTEVERFQLAEETILRGVKRNIDMEYGSLVLQSGEIESDAHTAFIEKLLHRITEMSAGKLGITLSLGEQSEETFARWRAAGAHRYLLRIETSNPALYAKLHPVGHNFERRVNCLRLLRKHDYQVGSGVMSGLPGQTYSDLANDILFFHELDLDMIGMGPYIPHHDTPLGQEIAFTPDYAADHLRIGLNMISVARLYLHDVNIAATTALQALADDGREQGILAGANVVMPNITDTEYRRNYQLYENKPCLDENSEQCRLCLARRLEKIGETVNWNQRGDSPHYAARQ
ncbi:MAG: [FeFe] hydrogenase H-cluster radical SAM maturase HydE [Kiritimatiellae bacterium]|nr:[FeFe] hydrogenase H-cluster radical SAM maturase HydE [Kiritimatiellia bacterium]